MGFIIYLGADDFYAGKTCVDHGQYFPVIASDEVPVKVYTTRRRAEAAAWKLARKLGYTSYPGFNSFSSYMEVVEYVE